MNRSPKLAPVDEVTPSRLDPDRNPAERLTFRLEDVVEALGVSRRTIERERSAGRFPMPDLHVGKMPLWKPETIRRWIDGGGHK